MAKIRIEVHVIALLLGVGIPLCPRMSQSRRLTLKSATPMVGGMVKLEYSIQRAAEQRR